MSAPTQRLTKNLGHKHKDFMEIRFCSYLSGVNAHWEEKKKKSLCLNNYIPAQRAFSHTHRGANLTIRQLNFPLFCLSNVWAPNFEGDIPPPNPTYREYPSSFKLMEKTTSFPSPPSLSHFSRAIRKFLIWVWGGRKPLKPERGKQDISQEKRKGEKGK